MVLPDALKKRVVIARTSVLKVRSWCGGAAIDVQRPKLSCQAWLKGTTCAWEENTDFSIWSIVISRCARCMGTIWLCRAGV